MLKANFPLEHQSSRMSLISLAGKVRLRLRSASLTAVTLPPSLSPSPACPFAALGAAQFQPGCGCKRTGWGGWGSWTEAESGGRGVGMGGRLLEVNPWGRSVQGPFSSLSLSVLAREEAASAAASLMKAVDAPYSSARQPQSLLPACHKPASSKERCCSVYPHYGNDSSKARSHSTLAAHAV